MSSSSKGHIVVRASKEDGRCEPDKSLVHDLLSLGYENQCTHKGKIINTYMRGSV